MQGTETFATTPITSLTSIGYRDVFLAKVSYTGNLEWAKQFGGVNSVDQGRGLGVDASGNIFITGNFDKELIIGSYPLTVSIPSIMSEVFTAKFDNSGAVIWAKQSTMSGTSGKVESYVIQVKGNGECIIAGNYHGTLCFDNITLSDVAGEVFVASYDINGNCIWAQNSGPVQGGDPYPYGLSLDGLGGIYLTGIFQGPTTFGATTLTHFGGFDIFIAKLGSCQFNWSPLGIGVNTGVAALAVIGTDLYAGEWLIAGALSSNYVVKWNGSNWTPIGSGMNGFISALAVIGTDLYAAGYFTTAGGVSANNIAKWDGSGWSALGSGTDNAVYSLAVIGSDLYAGGFFTTAGGVSVNNIAKWNGSDWSALSSGMNSNVTALMSKGTDLYAGGNFTTAGGISANRIAKWDGSGWSALSSGMNFFVRVLMCKGTDLYAGGNFTTAGGISANHIAKWNGSDWSALGSGMNIQEVRALEVIGSDLYAGGEFTSAGGISANFIAKWDGYNWSPLKTGTDSVVCALAVIGTDLYAGGQFTTAGNQITNFVARWGCTSDLTSVGENRKNNVIPQRLLLEQNYPNPFNPTSTIQYDIPKTDFVKISLFDILGREVRVLVNEEKSPGHYKIIFDAKELASGVYFYSIQVNSNDGKQNFRQTKKMILLK
jgi:hypothetical protein